MGLVWCGMVLRGSCCGFGAVTEWFLYGVVWFCFGSGLGMVLVCCGMVGLSLWLGCGMLLVWFWYGCGMVFVWYGVGMV